MMTKQIGRILLTIGALLFMAGPCLAYQTMTKEQLKDMLGKSGVYVIDIRTPDQWNYTTNKIPGAIHEKKGEMATWGKKYPKDAVIVVYCNCDNESTSGAVAQTFEEMGYKKAYALKGGWMAWLMAKYPTEKKDAPEPRPEGKQ